MSRRARLLVVGPLPPPVHGVTVSTSLVLANQLLREKFCVEHVDTSDHRTGHNIGKWDLTNISLAIRNVVSLLRKLIGPKGVVYLPISQSRAGLTRDTLFIQAAAVLGWRVVAHLRGGELKNVYIKSAPPFRAWLRRSLERLTALAVMGESLKGVADGLVEPDRIVVIPNGTPDISCPGPRDGQLVLFLSNLKRRKGIVEAVEAALAVVERHPSARFRFVGSWEDTELERRLVEHARSAGDRIRFLSAAHGAEKLSLLGAAGIFLFPPVEPEGHPRVVLEALCAGLPVVTTDRGAIRETVVDGDCGFILSDPEPALLADRLLSLLEDDALRQRMSVAARKRYLALYTQERADRVLSEWLESVVGSSAAPSREQVS